jgi:hypothetical protein
LHELGVQSELRGQLSRPLDGRGREVQPNHPGAATGPAQRVDAEVALQVDDVLAGDVSDLDELERPQALLASLKEATS